MHHQDAHLTLPHFKSSSSFVYLFPDSSGYPPPPPGPYPFSATLVRCEAISLNKHTRYKTTVKAMSLNRCPLSGYSPDSVTIPAPFLSTCEVGLAPGCDCPSVCCFPLLSLFNAFFALLFFGFVRRHAKVLVRLLSVLLLLPLLYFPYHCILFVFVPDDALNT